MLSMACASSWVGRLVELSLSELQEVKAKAANMTAKTENNVIFFISFMFID